MSENEKNQELELEEKNEIEGGDDGEKKPQLTPEQIRGIKMRQFTKLKKELGIAENPEANAFKPEAKEGFDYAELSYLAVRDVADEDHDYVLETLKDSGKSLKDLLGAKWLQSDLRERKESRATKNAIPSGTKRSTSSSRDSVDYWLSKPFTDVPKEMRREVLKARTKIESNKNKFTDVPIAN